jgi:hypothetical protein
MDKTLTDTLNAIRELRSERFAAKYDHLVDQDDAAARKRYNEVEAKLAKYDLRALLAEVNADHEQHMREYDAAVLLLTIRPTELARSTSRPGRRRRTWSVTDTKSAIATWRRS